MSRFKAVLLAAALAVSVSVSVMAEATTTVTVLAPTTSTDKLGIGASQRMRWQHDGGSTATFTLSLSRDGGTTFVPIVTNLGPTALEMGIDTRNYLYTVAPCATTCPESAVLRVTADDNASATDDSVMYEYVDLTPPIVKRPNAVQQPQVGVPFSWIAVAHVTGYQTQPGFGHLLELSYDDGATYPEVIHSSFPSPNVNLLRYYAWTPTSATCSPACRIRSTDYLSQQGVSGPFQILP